MSEPQFPPIAFVGSGAMAEVMIKGLLGKGMAEPARIWASGPRPERAAALTERYGVHGTTDTRAAVAAARIVVLAVKPQTLPKVLKQLKGSIRADHLVLSIIAGARMADIGAALDHPAIVRSMPNLPCQIHRGMTIWTATPEVTEPSRQEVRALLATMGMEIYVPDESTSTAPRRSTAPARRSSPTSSRGSRTPPTSSASRAPWPAPRSSRRSSAPPR